MRVRNLAPVGLGFLGADSFALIQKKAGTTTLGLQIFLDTEIRLTYGQMDPLVDTVHTLG
jgi:hypothetical protein